MLQCFHDVNCNMNWKKFNNAIITKIRSMRIELWCFERFYVFNFVNFAINSNVRHRFAFLSCERNMTTLNIAQCTMIQFQWFLHRWISLNSYYQLSNKCNKCNTQLKRCETMSSISTRRKHRKIKCLQSFKSSQLNAQRSNLNNFCIVEFHSIHSIIYIIEVLKHMWWLSIEQQMQQLRSQNLRFDDCRIAHSIDKKNLDEVHMHNLNSLIAKSNFFKKLLERSLLIIIVNV